MVPQNVQLPLTQSSVSRLTWSFRNHHYNMLVGYLIFLRNCVFYWCILLFFKTKSVITMPMEKKNTGF